jgi:hypothetical protein
MEQPILSVVNAQGVVTASRFQGEHEGLLNNQVDEAAMDRESTVRERWGQMAPGVGNQRSVPPHQHAGTAPSGLRSPASAAKA